MEVGFNILIKGLSMRGAVIFSYLTSRNYAFDKNETINSTTNHSNYKDSLENGKKF